MTDRPELDAWLAEADAALDEDGYGRTWEADAMHAGADALDEFPYQPPFQFAFALAIERAWSRAADLARLSCRGTDRHLKGGRQLPPESITCPRCGATSFHPDDVRAGYCGRCHWWTSDRTLGAPQVIAWAEAEGVIEPLSTR